MRFGSIPFRSFVSVDNSSTAVLTSGSTYTGTALDVSAWNSVVVAVKTDQDGTLYMEFSTDGTNWDSSLSFSVTANTGDVHRFTITRKYFRVRFTNTSVSSQTFFRLQTLVGDQQTLTSALNSIVQTDQDTVVVRPMDFNLMIAEGLYQNRANTIKDGLSGNITIANVPQDIWSNGGAYTGFPTGAVEAGEIVVAGADTGTVYYSYLESATSTDYIIAGKAVTGAGTYALGHNVWRCNFMYFSSTNTAVFNVGLITVRNTVTTANVFCQIPIGYSQSYCAAYTVPYGSAIYLDRINGSVRGGATATLDGFFWYRSYADSPRLRFPFSLQFGSLWFDDIDYLVKIPERVDMIPRILVSSANNVAAQIAYRLVKVKQ